MKNYRNMILSFLVVLTLAMSGCKIEGEGGSTTPTPTATQPVPTTTVTTEAVLKKVSNDNGFRKAVVFVKGIGPGREAALRAIKASSVDIDTIIDVTPVPHNGVRPPKVRRV